MIHLVITWEALLSKAFDHTCGCIHGSNLVYYNFVLFYPFIIFIFSNKSSTKIFYFCISFQALFYFIFCCTFQFAGDKLVGTQFLAPVDPNVEDALRYKTIFTVEVGPGGVTQTLCHRGYNGKHNCCIEQVRSTFHLVHVL